MSSSIRVRFAPSPIGYLHVGGARTALFNWLYVRKLGGTFILRIEDTDLERSTEEAIGTILEGLQWLGLTCDEGPYYQTGNLAAHKAAAEKLLASGYAYKAYETKEELDAKRKAAEIAKIAFKYDGAHRDLTPEQQAAFEAEGRSYIVRFKVPRDGGSVFFQDLVYGRQEKKFDDLEDFTILRSDGTPLYILSNVIDDIEQNITHIVRGQDHLANTPKQVLIYEALGRAVPMFAHLPLILDQKRAKVSKRMHGEAATVRFYQQHGFIPEAFLNFMALLGWSPGEDREVMSLEEMRDLFSLDRVSHTNAVFNLSPVNATIDDRNFTDPKLLWMNAEYIKSWPLSRLIPLVREQLEKAGLWQARYAGEDAPWFESTVDLIRQRYRLLTDFVTLGKPYFSDEFDFEPEAVKKNLKDPALKTLFPELADRLDGLTEFTHASVEAALRALTEERHVKAGLVINASRTALTGQSVGPGMFDVFVAIGKERAGKRLHAAVDKVAG